MDDYPEVDRAYILEAQVYRPKQGFAHVGYVDKIFRTESEAAEYYERRFPEMRRMVCLVSDWHPVTHMRYVIRRFHCEVLTLVDLI
jgi:hypothetical protein